MTAHIPTAKGRTILVDDADRGIALAYRWQFDRYGYPYAVRKVAGRRFRIYLHQLIAGAQPGVLVDHKDGDKLNCQRANLRRANHAENARNNHAIRSSTGYRGVSRHGKRKFQAHIVVNCHKLHLGTFVSAEEAARVRDAAAIKYHGEFAFLNFEGGSTDGSQANVG